MGLNTFTIAATGTANLTRAVTAASDPGSGAISTIVIGAITLIGTCLAMWLLAGGRFGGRK